VARRGHGFDRIHVSVSMNACSHCADTPLNEPAIARRHTEIERERK
jgi:hypothetical protein